MGMVVRTCGRLRGRKIDTECRMPCCIPDDGSVQVVAEGEKLAQLIARLEVGPRAARVAGVGVEWGEYGGKYNGFDIAF